jgi:GntR family transcriptional regulator
MTAHHGIDARSGVPLYMQVEKHIQDRIVSREWRPSTPLPNEQQLCDEYGVSRITVRHALARLTDKGLLLRERGRGTFVRDIELEASERGVRSFTTELHDLGMVPSSRLLGIAEVEPPRSVATALAIEPGMTVVRIHRVRLGDGRPIGVQTAYLTAARFPGLVTAELERTSLYEVLADRYGVTPIEAVETFTVGGVTDTDAPLLEVEPGAHAFYVERVTYDGHGPFEQVFSVMRGDRYRVRHALRNKP